MNSIDSFNMCKLNKELLEISGIGVSWNLFDICDNFFNNAVNWPDLAVKIKDSKPLVSFDVNYYNHIQHTNTMLDIRQYIPTGIIDIDAIRQYFKQAGFQRIFNNIDVNTVCKLDADDFIVIPLYETKHKLYIAVINTNTAFSSYLRLTYPDTKQTIPALLDLVTGLQNHSNIFGITTATSLNLFQALYKYHITKPVKSSILIDDIQLLVVNLFNNYNYFPRLHVIWHNDKIYIMKPGGHTSITNDTLIGDNKIITAVTPDTYKILPAIAMAPEKPPNHPGQKFKWPNIYTKYCGSPDVQYENYNDINKRFVN